MTVDKQIDPCVSLQVKPEGILLTTSAQLREGALNWTPEEAGEWFARTWQEAQSMLILATVQRSRLMVDGETRLVRQGCAAWQVEEAVVVETVLPPPPSQGISRTQKATRGLLAKIAEPDPNPSSEEPSSVGVRISERIAETPDQRKLIRTINQSSEPLTQAALKRETKLSDYRIKKAMAVLIDKGFVRESRVETGGRWKESAAYSASGGEG